LNIPRNEISFSKSIYFLSDAEILSEIRLATVTAYGKGLATVTAYGKGLATVTAYGKGLATVTAYLPFLPRTFHNMLDASRRLNLELFYLFHYD